ncbi:unnamed protein product [Trichogramma brassicae]|uniref:C2H2-type domain-containing protein n=1 Tax=Trichogramma brassicae TaxID=86971 RepID=A0A6H5I4Y9_9HYME|nr:unnamed protein product [Trichogramma brassicae]
MRRRRRRRSKPKSGRPVVATAASPRSSKSRFLAVRLITSGCYRIRLYIYRSYVHVYTRALLWRDLERVLLTTMMTTFLYVDFLSFRARRFMDNKNTPRRKSACDICQEAFTLESSMITRRDTSHNHQKDYVCDKCEKKFEFRSHLSRHQISEHRGCKDFACNRCDKIFLKKSSLFTHQKLVHKDRENFTCTATCIVPLCNVCGSVASLVSLPAYNNTQQSVRDTSSQREQQAESPSASLSLSRGKKIIIENMEDEDDHYFVTSDGECYVIVSDEDNEYDETADEDKFEILKSMRDEVRWAVEDERRELLRRLDPLISSWWQHLPDLRDVFQAGEIDWLLGECATEVRDLRNCIRAKRFVEFVIRTGYVDEPELDEASGEPLLLSRATALHRAVGCQNYDTVPALFEIYNRLDVNYADEAGFTHFHAACQADCEDVVERFLELGQVDPDYPVAKTGDAPLHVALRAGGRKVARLLLSRGADPNRANAKGLTPLHVTSQRFQDDDLSDVLFEREGHRRVEVNARDETGWTPLHYALAEGLVNETERLLRRGADQNLADDHGSTPLHVICKRARVDFLGGWFFKFCDLMNRPVQINVEDASGRTPLQWAVAKLMPPEVDLLLDRGADLASFRFPSEDYFAAGRRTCECGDKNVRLEFKVRLAACALMVVERLEERGYRLAGNDVLAVMKPFAGYGLFAETEDDRRAALNDEYFARTAKEHALNDEYFARTSEELAPSETTTSFYELVQLRAGAGETERLPFRYEDYHEFVGRSEYLYLAEEPSDACARHVCEIMSRRFFREKTLDFFVELTRHELPILCCERILKQLTNRDLYNVCLAATIQNHYFLSV